MDLSKVFSQEATVASHAGWAVFGDGFEAAIGDLAQVLALSLPSTEQRPAFTAEYINKARKAVSGLQANGADEEVDAATKSRLLLEAQAQKHALLQEIVASLQANGLAATSPHEVEGFSNLLIALLVYVEAPAASFDAVLPILLPHLSSAAALNTLLSLLPEQSASASIRLQFFVKSIRATERAAPRAAALRQRVLPFLRRYPVDQAQADDAVASLVDLALQHDDADSALALLEAYQPAGEALQRQWVRLALAKPTAFAFPPNPALPEASLVAYVLSESASLDAGLLAAPAPALSPDALQVKRSAVAIAKLFAEHVGQKVAYADILPIIPAAADRQDEDVLVESAVIDAIKSKLVQARLSQPQRTATVVSSRYPSLPHLNDAGNDLAKWKAIQAKLTALRSSLAALGTSLDAAVGQAAPAPAANGDEATA